MTATARRTVGFVAALALGATVLVGVTGPAGASRAAARIRVDRPAPGPAAVITALSGGDGTYLASATPSHLRAAKYVQHEYAAAGTATSYRANGPLTKDGRWSFVPGAPASYKTRIVVREPAKAKDRSGTVIVEWLNVSGGVDADPEWSSVQEEIIRRGDTWVGVSAQPIGVEGGPVAVKVTDVPGAGDAGKGLKTIDPARYGSLHHPGDGYSFDMFTQVGRALRAGRGLDHVRPKRVVAAGESQSAFGLVTYVNGVQPLTHAFDGFFVHSRGGSALPLVGPGQYADIASAIGGPAAIFRTDQTTPVMDIQTETDLTSVLGSYLARQPDNRHFRLWEVAGTAHADAHLVGSAAKYLHCGVPINDGPMHVVAKAAWHDLARWLETGTPPPHAPRIEVDTSGGAPVMRRDADGIVLGGIRTPPVDVPVTELSGAPGPDPSVICLLLGSSKPFSEAQIADRYPSRAAYVKKYDADLDRTVQAGFALAADRGALAAYAHPRRVPR